MSTPDDSAVDLITRAKQAYLNPRGKSVEEFVEDFSRLRYIKRLANRRVKGMMINDRLLLNHIVVWFNVFEVHKGLDLLLEEIDVESLPIILAYTDYLNLTTHRATTVPRCQQTVTNLSML